MYSAAAADFCFACQREFPVKYLTAGLSKAYDDNDGVQLRRRAGGRGRDFPQMVARHADDVQSEQQLEAAQDGAGERGHKAPGQSHGGRDRASGGGR